MGVACAACATTFVVDVWIALPTQTATSDSAPVRNALFVTGVSCLPRRSSQVTQGAEVGHVTIDARGRDTANNQMRAPSIGH
jgi:hypothetical protein